MIDIFEKFQLNGIAGPADRFDAVDHHAPHAANKVAVEKCNRGVQPGIQFAAPLVPGVEIEIVARHPFAAAIEDVQKIAVPSLRIKEIGERRFLRRIRRIERPIEHPPAHIGMALRIAAHRHVENNSRTPFLPPPCFGELRPQLRFADARRADNHGQPPRQQAAAEEFVESGMPVEKTGHVNWEVGVGIAESGVARDFRAV